MNPILKNSLTKRKDRALAIILGYKEKNIDEYLPEEVQRKFRKQILDQVNDLYEFAIDILNSEDDGVILNQIYLEKIDEIHEMLKMEDEIYNG